MGELCTTCLCTDRKVSPLEDVELRYVFHQILNEISEESVWQATKLCWECNAELRRVKRFRLRALASARALLHYRQTNIPPYPLPPRLTTCNIEQFSCLLIKTESDVDVTGTDVTDVTGPDITDVTVGEVSVDVLAVKEEPHCEPETFVHEIRSTKGSYREDKATKQKNKIKTKDKIKSKKKSKRNHEQNISLNDNDCNIDRDGSFDDVDVTVNQDVNVTTADVTDISEHDIKEQIEIEIKLPTSKIDSQTTNSKFSDSNLNPKDVLEEKESFGEMNRDGEGIEKGDLMLGTMRCFECDMVFEVRSELENHYIMEHSKEAPTVKKVRKPRCKEELPDRPTCAECGKRFSSKKTYRYHINTLHKGQDRYPCPRCNRVYRWKSNLGRHIRTHKAVDTGELYCEPCDKKFASIATYRQHLKISKRHVSETDFSFMCNECGKKFVSKTRLRDHIDWEHLNHIKFKCHLCVKPFKCQTSLYVHVQNVHRNKEKKDNLCHVCGKSYQNAAKLKYHIMALHSQETPYRCPHCTAAFSWHSSLYRHVREVHFKMKIQPKKCKKNKKLDMLPTLPPPLHPPVHHQP